MKNYKRKRVGFNSGEDYRKGRFEMKVYKERRLGLIVEKTMERGT